MNNDDNDEVLNMLCDRKSVLVWHETHIAPNDRVKELIRCLYISCTWDESDNNDDDVECWVCHEWWWQWWSPK